MSCIGKQHHIINTRKPKPTNKEDLFPREIISVTFIEEIRLHRLKSSDAKAYIVKLLKFFDGCKIRLVETFSDENTKFCHDEAKNPFDVNAYSITIFIFGNTEAEKWKEFIFKLNNIKIFF